MGDKDNNLFFGDTELYFCTADNVMKPIGKAIEHSINYKSDTETDLLKPSKQSYSFSATVEGDFNKLFDLEPLRKAQAMLDKLREYSALYHKYYGMGMRKERRRIKRDFDALRQRFLRYCEINDIKLTPKRQEQ